MLVKLRTMCGFALLWFFASVASAHPVPKDSHDRTIVVRLQKGDAPNKIRVRVEYRLEVDEETVLLRDMREHRDEVNYVDYFPQRPFEYYGHYTRIYAPVFSERLVAEANGKRFKDFECISRKERLHDDDGMKLGHLRCDFVFESAFDIAPGKKATFFFHDQTYLSGGIAREPGQLTLNLVNESGLAIESRMDADETLRKRPTDQLEPSEEDRLRKITIVFAATGTAAPEVAPPPTPRELRKTHDETFSLLRLILHTDYGFWLTMLCAFLFGGAHALTPGHGKALVAAYLVGERGTVWHACFLGIVTTLTHTGVVISVAIILVFLPNDMQQAFRVWIQNGLGLILGLLVTCMGFWLLLQRLAGRADHIHLDGGHHHAHETPAARTLTWWGLVVLGATGGMIPCWDAVGVLMLTVGTNEFWLVLPAVLVFSAGLAIVLVAIGIVVVQVPRFVETRFGSGRVLRALPIVSAILVTVMGLWLCYEGVHGR